jgi:hypothetical protein
MPTNNAEPNRPVRDLKFTPGTVVSPGMYRNSESGQVRYFDGQTPLPGGANAAGWQQVSDHYHTPEPADEVSDQSPRSARELRFPAGTQVSPGMYRNVDSGHVRYFDGQTRLPGGVNASSWQQVSDHYHIGEEAARDA